MQLVRLFILLIGTFVTGLITQISASSGSGGGGLPVLPSYVIIDDDSSIAQLSDDEFNHISGRLIFKVNRTNLRLDDPFIIQLTDSVLPYANRAGWILTGIELRGGASPEGPYSNNVRLARERARALRDYINSHLTTDHSDETVITTVPEDYAYLLWLLERDGDSAAPLLRRIIDECGSDNPSCIKEKLQQLYDGRYWYRLLRDYFPKVRAARVVLRFRHINPVEREEIASSVPQAPLIAAQTDFDLSPIFRPAPPRLVDRPHMLSISTNALYDVFYMPNFGWAPMLNVGLEWFPRNSAWTLRAQFTSPYYHRWSRHKFFQIRDYHLEVRRYFHPGQWHTGLYAAAYGNFTKYGIGISDRKGWQGEGGGVALKLGYVIPLGSGRWRVDFHAAVGGFITRYDPYVYGNPITGDVSGDDYWYDWVGSAASFKRRNHRFTWFGPTEIGVTFSYDLLFYRLNQGGASFVGKEVTW